MYEVSEIYPEILKEPVLTDSVKVDVTLKDGTVLELSDADIVKNSLKITHELCREYRIGTFNLGVLKLGFFDDDALSHDFSGAEIKVYYSVDSAVDSAYDIPMGIFLADGQTVKRRRDTVTLTAYDYGILFDCTISQSIREMEATAEGFLSHACNICGVVYGGIHDKLPNREVIVTATSPQIQSYRDIIEWCAALLCGYAVIDRLGRLKIISARYDVDEEDSTEIITQKLLDSSERNSIYSTDTRAWIAEISAYCGDKRKIYRSEITQSDEQAARAVYTLEKNPLLIKKTMAECDEINRAWLSYIDGFKQRGITAEIYGDAALDVGDVMRCSGGDIDQRGSVVGLVTRSEWCYRNFHRLECAAAQLSDGFPDETEGSEITEDYLTHEPVAVSSQLEKKIEAVEAATGVGVFVNEAKNAEVFNDYLNYTIYHVGEHGDYSHSEGYDSHALGAQSHAEGNLSIARGKASHTEGSNTSTDGDYSHSEGLYCSTDGIASHAEGASSYSVGDYSHAEGYAARAYGYGSHAGGVGTQAQGKAQTAIGIYNVPKGDDYLFVVGCGTGGTSRENALELDNKGNLTIKGKLTANGGTAGGSGASYTAGDGIIINSSDEICADIDYKTIILDENNKLKAVGVTIENAVIIRESDSAFLVHEYTQTEYIDGNRIGYTGPDNQIIIQGIISYKKGSEAPNGVSISEVSNKSAENFPDIPVYGSMLFKEMGVLDTSTNYYCAGFHVEPTELDTSYNKYRLAFKTATEDGGESTTTWGYNQTVYDNDCGVTFVWDKIYPPGTYEATTISKYFPYGYAVGYLFVKRKSTTSGNYTSTIMSDRDCALPFLSEAEYNAAVGLTYESQTLTQVNETVTEA